MKDEIQIGELHMPEVIAQIPPLPSIYDENDSRVIDILNAVSAFCGKEFTEVPPNPEDENTPVPLADVGDIDVTESEDEEEEEERPTPPPLNPGVGPGDIAKEEYKKKVAEYKAALEKNLQEKQDYWAMLWQVIRLISTMACWTESYDDTFIVQYRTQRYEAEQACNCCGNCCKCDEDVVTIPIEYAPLELHPDESKNGLERQIDAKPFIGGKISVIVDGKREEVDISQEYLNERYDPYTQKLYINREDFPDILYTGTSGACCLCKRKLMITLYYNAGYYAIPQAILPLICQLMGKIEESKKPLSDCTAAVTQVSGLMKSMKLGNIQYTWSDKDTAFGNTQALFTEIFNIASVAELYSISRCNIVNIEEAGDVV